MPFYEFRCDTRTRQVPRFADEQRARLEELLRVRLDSCSPGLGAPVPWAERHLEQLEGCRDQQCLLGIHTASRDVEVTLGMLASSASVVIKVDHRRSISEDQVDELRRELFTYVDGPDSVSVKDLDAAYLRIAQDRDIPGPSAYFASGLEWFKHLSPTVWQEHYSRHEVLAAPVDVEITLDGSLRWRAYDSLLHFDAEAVTASRRYFGERRRPGRSSPQA